MADINLKMIDETNNLAFSGTLRERTYTKNTRAHQNDERGALFLKYDQIIDLDLFQGICDTLPSKLHLGYFPTVFLALNQ